MKSCSPGLLINIVLSTKNSYISSYIQKHVKFPAAKNSTETNTQEGVPCNDIDEVMHDHNEGISDEAIEVDIFILVKYFKFLFSIVIFNK